MTAGSYSDSARPPAARLRRGARELDARCHFWREQPATAALQQASGIDDLAREPDGGLLVLSDPSANIHRDFIVALAARKRLPAVYPFRSFVVSGGLVSYGVDRLDQYRRAAEYVGRILRGEKPAELPVQAPIKFELAINLKTVKALDLTVAPALLAAADELIE